MLSENLMLIKEQNDLPQLQQHISHFCFIYIYTSQLWGAVGSEA